MPEWRWLLWYYGRVLELPYFALLALATWGRPVTRTDVFDEMLNDYLERTHNGKRHCLYAPAYASWWDECWYRDGQRHRIDGPAYQARDGTKEWWLNDQRHRQEKGDIERAEDPSQFL